MNSPQDTTNQTEWREINSNEALELLGAFSFFNPEKAQRLKKVILALLQDVDRASRLDEWEWIRQNMPYTDQGALFEARAMKRIAALQPKKGK